MRTRHAAPLALALTTATLVASVVALADVAPLSKGRPAPMGRPHARPAGVAEIADEGGLEIRVEDASPSEGVEPRPPLAETEPLSRRELESLLERIPPPAADDDDRRDAALAPRPVPPPRAGATVMEPFPPPPLPATRAPDERADELTVLRHGPEGEVDTAPGVSLTFSLPMVELAAVRELGHGDVPARLEPAVAGRWRWLGTQTLVFEAGDGERMPRATRYVVEVPAGTRSATGATLREAVRWTFQTPPPSVQRFEPVGPPLRPLLVLLFDQAVSPRDVARHVTLAAGGADAPLELASCSIDTDDGLAIRRALGEIVEERCVALRPRAELPPQSDATLVVAAGTPSLEGPLVSGQDFTTGFRTLDPLRVVSHRCGWEDRCPPGEPFWIELNNPLDPEAFDPALVTVRPAIDDLVVNSGGASLWLAGTTKARTTYEVRLDGKLRDVHGQELGRTVVLKWSVGPALPRLTGPPQPMVVLDPASPPALHVFTAGLRSLRVTVHAVEPEDWAAFWTALQQERGPTRPGRLPGREVVARRLAIEGHPDDVTDTAIDLRPALGEDGLGHAVVLVEPGEDHEEVRGQFVAHWVQSTRIGLDAFVDRDELVAWATDLGSGSPLAGVDVALSAGPRGATDPDGLARFELPGTFATPQVLVARRDGDVALLPEQTWGWWPQETSWRRQPAGSRVAWHVFDDRGLYRPGEVARLKGWVRALDLGERGDVELVKGAARVAWTLRDPVGNELLTGTAPVGGLGGFDLEVALPQPMNLGHAQVELTLAGAGAVEQAMHWQPLRVEEFRRPEYEVSVEMDAGPHLVGGDAVATASAAYFAGGALPGAPASWTLTATPGDYRPPGWDGWAFGRWRPWWMGGWGWPQPAWTRTFTHEGVTGADGRHAVRMEFLSIDPPEPARVEVQAVVTDVNRQAWADRASIVVHPSRLYVGLRAPRAFVDAGEDVVVEVVAVDLDGAAAPGRDVDVRLARIVSRLVKGSWTEVEEDVLECRVESGTGPAACRFSPRTAGTWRATARVVDDEGRPNETTLTTWVAGREEPEQGALESQEVQVIPDREEYAAGDVARLLVRSPFAPAEALLTLRRSGLVHERRVALEHGSVVVEVPIEESWTPNVHAQVDVVGARADGTPAYGTGSVVLRIPPRTRTLEVVARARRDVLVPGAEATIDVEVRDERGEPAESELAIVVADEAVLALTGYALADPVASFYPEREPGVSDHRLRPHVVLVGDALRATREALQTRGFLGGGAVGMADGAVVAQEARATAMPAAPPMAMDAAASLRRDKSAANLAEREEDGGADGAISVRTDLRALAHFEPTVVTGPDGRASVTFTLPDSLTRYRVMAVAVSGAKRFGKGESPLTARRELMVRPSAPRFLNFGDRAGVPVVLQNLGDDAREVAVAVRGTNVRVEGPAGVRVRVPARDRVEVRFPVTTDAAGTARLQFVAASGSLGDAAEIAVPVWTPATTEAFATYGTIDEGAVTQPVLVPSDVISQFGGLSVTTSSTAMHELGDAVLYLVRYPYDCVEQVASRVLAVAALRDMLGAYSQLPPPAEIFRTVEADLEVLARRQNDDGSYGLWRRGEPAWPYVGVHAAHAMLRAREKGFAVDETALARSRSFLREVERHFRSDYSEDARRSIVAYALHVRRLAGDADPERARRLVADAKALDEIPLEAIGWILPTLAEDAASSDLHARLVQHLRGRVTETPGAAHFATSYGEDHYLVLWSERRADAVLLDAMVETEPGSDLLPKLVRGLLDHRTAGRWDNTQENAFVLLALDRYFQRFEREAPDFTATAWVGRRTVLAQEHRGRSTERRVLEIPLPELGRPGAREDLVLAKEGRGRLYYRLGLEYAPSSLSLDPSSQGFTVERTYEAVDDPGDVTRDDDGTWRVRAGALVRIRTVMAAPARRTHVALAGPLPAGLEALNAGLATTETVPGGGADRPGWPGPIVPLAERAGGSWWWGRWWEHENLRDERTEAFASLVWPGAHEHVVTARATTPGRFVVPPAKAEEMYHPEVFGRSGTDVVIVE